MTQHVTLADDARADAFALVVIPLLGQLTAFAKRRMTSAQDAEDMVQDACVRAWQGFSTLRDTSRAAPWLFRILRSVMADEYGKQERRRELVSISRLEDVYEGLLVSEDDPYANAVSRMTLDHIEDALQRIPDDFAMTVELHDVNGLRYAEIAEVMGVPIGTVMSRLSRGRQLIAGLLSGTVGLDAGATGARSARASLQSPRGRSEQGDG